VILFLYGSLLDPAVWRRHAGGKPNISGRPARLSGWRRVGLRGSSYPTLRRGGAVKGLLRRVDAATLRRLIAYEGPRYALRRVVVATAHGKTPAWIWIAAGATRRPWKE
jgi:gamma-glutamylcyclotransferase (GGCT)/AIG2-like uncharacterized protein YtfP